MSFAVRMRQLARMFVDAQSLAISAEQLQQVSQAARLIERLSTPIVLPAAVADPVLPAGSPKRFVLASEKLDWQLVLLSQSFDLTRLPTDITGSNIGNLSDFAAVAADVLWDSANFFGRAPHRLVLAQDGLLGEMASEKMDSIARRLLCLPPSFDTHPTAEWDWRCVRHGAFAIADREEKTNSIATIKRAHFTLHGQNEGLDLERIFVQLDVNTSPDDTRGRFQAQDVKQFFLAAVEEHSRLLTELNTFAFEVPDARVS